MQGIPLAIILLVLGMAAIFMEVFIPSGGLISVGAIGCIIGSVAVAFVQAGATAGFIFLMAALLLTPTCLIVAFGFLPKTPMGKRLTLTQSQRKEEGYSAQSAQYQELLGKEGVTLSALRPSGEARIEGKRYDVVTEGDMVEPNAKIVVYKTEGNRIVVRRSGPESDA